MDYAFCTDCSIYLFTILFRDSTVCTWALLYPLQPGAQAHTQYMESAIFNEANLGTAGVSIMFKRRKAVSIQNFKLF